MADAEKDDQILGFERPALAVAAVASIVLGALAPVPEWLEPYMSEEWYVILVAGPAFLFAHRVVKLIAHPYGQDADAEISDDSTAELEADLDEADRSLQGMRALVVSGQRQAAELAERVGDVEHRLAEVEHHRGEPAGHTDG